ncbi:unnamed protein product [Cuscuta epithymum]|uniref:GRF-type domain-containing protein n=1 Tax=Cuscuta epithymum TaxID=186058 RepID=A0AAV0F020_9ASTE|nr:unnamed protein product [Cuscuta epithymum]CAH9128809.1 unnamed protein product [Cuscuta epithymum]
MGSTSWSSSSARREETQMNSAVECHHKVCPIARTVKSGPNRGRRFYGCAFWPKSDCSFFQWIEEYPPPMASVVDKLSEKEIVMNQLEQEIKALQDQIAKLKKKKEKMRATIQELQTLVCKHAKGEKYAFIGVLVSWIVFAIVLYGKPAV